MQKIPYILVVGAKEQEANAVAVRARGGSDLGSMPVDAFVRLLQADIQSKGLNNQQES